MHEGCDAPQGFPRHVRVVVVIGPRFVANPTQISPGPQSPSTEQLEPVVPLRIASTTPPQQSLAITAIREGERALVIGASGGVGTYAVQLAKALGAEVTGVCSEEKMELVRNLGADHVIDYGAQDFADGAMKYDLVLDIGGNTPLGRLRRTLTERGRLVFVGGEDGGDVTGGFGRQLFAAVLAPFVKQRFIMLMSREHFSFLERLVAFCDAGQLRPVIDRRISLAEVADAIRDLAAGKVPWKGRRSGRKLTRSFLRSTEAPCTRRRPRTDAGPAVSRVRPGSAGAAGTDVDRSGHGLCPTKPDAMLMRVLDGRAALG